MQAELSFTSTEKHAMKIFISWSGVRSKYIANALRDWLPNVIQATTCFISTQDIAKGTRGGNVIMENLEQANIGIICLTPENLTAPWVLFEAGALSKLSSSAYVCTYLFDLEPSNIAPPLGQFQHTKVNESETKALIETINVALKEAEIESSRLTKIFDVWWPVLKEQLDATPAKPENETQPETRSESSKIDEILEVVRQLTTPRSQPNLATKSVRRHLISDGVPIVINQEVYDEKSFLNDISSGAVSARELPTSVVHRLVASNLVNITPEGMLTLTPKGLAERVAMGNPFLK